VKLKTRKSIAKRFKFTKKKKIKFHGAYKSHILSKKGRARKRKLRQAKIISTVDLGKIRRSLPYG
jgi:large subunit ribosomal protein L35